jgi:hypothetical protein
MLDPYKRPFTGVLNRPLLHRCPAIPAKKAQRSLLLEEPSLDRLRFQNDESELLRLAASQERIERIRALAEYYKVELNSPGCFKDLALSLSYRYEKSLLIRRGETKIQFARVFTKYGVNPESAKADYLLTIAIARKHIKGFTESRDHKRSDRLNDRQATVLVAAFAIVFNHLKTSGEKPTDSAISRIILDEEQMKVLDPTLQPQLDEVLQSLTNNRSIRAKPSLTTIRNHVRRWRTIVSGGVSRSQKDKQMDRAITWLTKLIDESGGF